MIDGDQFHQSSIELMEDIKLFHILLPWPVMYEFMRTQFVRDKRVVNRLIRVLKTLKIHYFCDSNYREKAFKQTLEWSSIGKRDISFVDMILRCILQDINVKVDLIVTCDCSAFTDICKRREGLDLYILS